MSQMTSRFIAPFLLMPVLGGWMLLGCGADSAGSATRGVAETVSAQELAKTLDLSKFPAPAGTEFNTRTAAEVQALAPLAIQPTAEFYLKEFAKLGFKPSGEPGSHIVSAEYAQASLVKDGHTISLSVLPGQDGKVMVSIYRHGNLDARTLPQSEGATPSHGSSTLHMYVARGSVAEESKFIEQAFAKLGWQQFVPPHTSMADDPDHRQFTFRKQGYVASASVGVAPAQQNKTMVQYQVRTLAHELPAPLKATKVEFDDDRVTLDCDIPDDLEAVDKFYAQAMPAAGCRALEHDEPRDKGHILRYETPDKGIFLIRLKTEDHKSTHVNFLYYSPELLAKMREQEGKPLESADTSAPSGTAERAEKKIVAQSIPLPVPKADIEYKAESEEINFRSPRTIEELVKALREKLKATGWQEPAEAPVAEANTGALLFQQGDATLTIVLLNTGLGDGTQVTIHASGLAWGD